MIISNKEKLTKEYKIRNRFSYNYIREWDKFLNTNPSRLKILFRLIDSLRYSNFIRYNKQYYWALESLEQYAHDEQMDFEEWQP